MVFETLGGVNEQGEKVLRQLFTFASKKLGREFSSYCSRAWARVSCCLQRSIAQVILNRIDGVSDESELPSESFALALDKPSWPTGEFSEVEALAEAKSHSETLSELPKAELKSEEPLSQGYGERPGDCRKIERREGGGIMNTTHKSTIHKDIT